MHIGMIALGGCIKSPPVDYGITPDTGGHITYLMDEADALARREDVSKVTIYTRRFVAPDLGPQYAREREDVSKKIEIVRVSSGDLRYLSKEALERDLRAWTSAFCAYLGASRRPDILHAHFADAAHAALAARELFGMPVAYTAHSLAHDKAAAMGTAGLAHRLGLEGRAIADADFIIASSRDECERQLMAYDGARSERIYRCPPGILPASPSEADIQGAQELIAPFLRDCNRPIVFAVARPVAKKNLPALIDMFGRSHTLRERANLVILSGLRKDLEHDAKEHASEHRGMLEAIDRHNLYGQCALPKRHHRGDVEGMYALAAGSRGIFVNPALFEPYGLTLLEAAAHGLPVVTTDQGGPVDIIRDYGHGVLADPRDEVGFGRSMEALITDEVAWTRCANRAKDASRHPSWDDYAARFVDLGRRHTQEPTSPEMPDVGWLALCDIDGTLTGSRDDIRRLRRLFDLGRSWGFGVATGRSLQEADRLLRSWALPDPDLLVTSVGSEIYWKDKAGRRHGDRDYEKQIDQQWDADEVSALLRNVDGLRGQAACEHRRFKRSYFLDDADALVRVEDLLATAESNVRIIVSHGNLVDILPVRAGKAAAMRWVSTKLGLPLDRIVACGDSGNDRDMLEACPNAVLVANHSDDVANLRDRANVYLSQRPHAGGVREGLLHVARRHRSASAA